MELLWDFALTLAVSFLLPSIFLKLFSFSSYDEADNKVAIPSIDHVDDIKKTEEVVLIRRNFDEFIGESIMDKLLEANCGSPILLSEVTENHVDESSQMSEISEVDEDVEISRPDDDGNFDEIIGECSKKVMDDDKEGEEWFEEDDWEGIESSELDKIFGAAVSFVESKSNANCIANLGNDVKMQLYGLHKIATQGPCHKPQPMALNFSARAKWYFINFY